MRGRSWDVDVARRIAPRTSSGLVQKKVDGHGPTEHMVWMASPLWDDDALGSIDV